MTIPFSNSKLVHAKQGVNWVTLIEQYACFEEKATEGEYSPSPFLAKTGAFFVQWHGLPGHHHGCDIAEDTILSGLVPRVFQRLAFTMTA
jgi:hypothetical protein